MHRRLLYDRHTAKCATLNAKTHCFTFRFVILEIGQGVTQHRDLKLNFYLKKKGEDTSLSGVLCKGTTQHTHTMVPISGSASSSQIFITGTHCRFF